MDRYDLLALVGLALLNLGLAAVYWPLAPLITGILILIAVIWRASRERPEVRNGTDNQPGETRS